MEKRDEFYVGYANQIGPRTKRLLKRYLLIVVLLLVLAGIGFSYFQKPAANSSFEFDTNTSITGVYYKMPYPMLRVVLAPGEYKDILLLGFGKYGANPYLDKIMEEEGSLIHKKLTIEGNLIYYNGQTLLQIDESTRVTMASADISKIAEPVSLGEQLIEGEIVDPKCYFGVMKPGYGKIHRSCAARCISGGMPPVLVRNNENNSQTYFLITDMKGNPINKDILPYIGQPSVLKGIVEQTGDWPRLKIEVSEIQKLDKPSSIY